MILRLFLLLSLVFTGQTAQGQSFAAEPLPDLCLDSLSTPGLDPERRCSDTVAELESLLTRTPSDTVALASAYNNRAVGRIRSGDLEGAAIDLGRAMTLEPSNWATYLNRGNLMLSQGQHQAALLDYQRAAGFPGAPQEVLSRNASLAFRALGDLNSAQASLAPGARLSPAAPDPTTADTSESRESPDP